MMRPPARVEQRPGPLDRPAFLLPQPGMQPVGVPDHVLALLYRDLQLDADRIDHQGWIPILTYGLAFCIADKATGLRAADRSPP